MLIDYVDFLLTPLAGQSPTPLSTQNHPGGATVVLTLALARMGCLQAIS
jgi:hypothetical protein